MTSEENKKVDEFCNKMGYSGFVATDPETREGHLIIINSYPTVDAAVKAEKKSTKKIGENLKKFIDNLESKKSKKK